MAFLLNRSGKQMVQLSSSSSSSWAATPRSLRLLTSRVNNNNNCFSTTAASSSPGGMNQQSNPKMDDAALKADMLDAYRVYFAKNLANLVQNKPLIYSKADWHKFLDDLLQKYLTHLDSGKKNSSSVIDQSEMNSKAVTAEMIKATSEFGDFISGGLIKHLKEAFKVKGDKFRFALDTSGLYLTVNVSRLGKEQLAVWVVRDRVLVASSYQVPPDQMLQLAIQMPENHDYDPAEVTGTIMEDGQLKISFPVSKEGRTEEKDDTFQVNLV